MGTFLACTAQPHQHWGWHGRVTLWFGLTVCTHLATCILWSRVMHTTTTGCPCVLVCQHVWCGDVMSQKQLFVAHPNQLSPLCIVVYVMHAGMRVLGCQMHGYQSWYMDMVATHNNTLRVGACWPPNMIGKHTLNTQPTHNIPQTWVGLGVC